MQPSKPNQHGVLPEGNREIVASRGRAFAAVRFALSEDGLYRYGLELNYSYGGLSYPICIDGEGFPTVEAARTAALEQLLRSCPKSFPSDPEGVRAELADLRRQIEQRVRQPMLF
ncbi:MAG: hypothetical protein SFY96_12610 [Planctomycetota bacterium]|nr:hypothetical protein [Planctomycetota bacterium]